MKIFLFLFVLLFLSSVFADDISDFEIEGMSLGDNLLNHYTLEEINNAYMYKYKKDEFRYYILYPKSGKTYDFLQITIKSVNEFTSSNKMEIHGISGSIRYYDNISDCYPKQDIIKKEFDLFFEVDGITNSGLHSLDKTNKSTYRYVQYFLDDNSIYGDVTIFCYDMSKEIEDKGFKDQLQVIISTQDLLKFINEVNWK